MKRILNIILMIIAITSLTSASAFAIGDGNLDGGGGSMDEGSSHSYWYSGNDGVRVTVVKSDTHQAVAPPIDLTNQSPTDVQLHFGKVSKTQYISGTSLVPSQSSYKFINPSQSLPPIISSQGKSNIEAIKSYFTDEQVIRSISDLVGMDFDVLISGDYKLLLEPLAYYKFYGVMIATTATEAALYDEVANGMLRTNMGNLTHKNLPLAMFLEVSDLGYPAWSGSTTGYASNANIKSSLGLGIVRFTALPETPQLSYYDYEYRVNTEVITSVYVSGGEANPDNPASVTFKIDGKNYNVGNIYYPEGDSQIAWVKWTTPPEAQEMQIYVTSSGRTVSKSTINVNIIDLDKNPPPNPVADDRNDDFEYSSVPAIAETEKLTWSVWTPWWKPLWQWESNWQWEFTGKEYVDGEYISDSGYWVDNGHWVDNGSWEFNSNQYYASLNASMDIVTDSYNPTADGDTFKSGYGINQTASSKVSTNQSSAVTNTPNAVSYFPEFNYQTYWRLLERMKTGTTAEFKFKENMYSTYNNRTHFSPIWIPDGPYTVNTHLIDVWCPTGMLSANLTDTLTVEGDLWQDWHIGPKDNE